MAELSTPVQESETGGSYPIRAVSRMTGLSVHTIRAWEKRYGAVDPNRTDTQRRAYTREQIRKLRLLRALVETGQPISSVARLTIEGLEQRLDAGDGQKPELEAVYRDRDATRFRHLGVAGSCLLSLVETQAALMPGMEVTRAWDSLESALEEGPPAEPLDLLAVEVGTLFPIRVGQIRDLAARCCAAKVIVVYGFAPRETVMELNRNPRFTALRSPVNAEELRLAAARPFEHPVPASATSDGQFRELEMDPAAIPDPLFTPQQLARLARMSGASHCECTQHMTHLIASLAAFEAYTSECQNRNADDAALHAFLQRATATARREIEAALKRALEVEGIHL